MKTPEEKNFYTSNKDRMFHVKEMIDWDKLSQVRDVDKESYNSFMEMTVGNVTGRKLAPRAPKNNADHYKIEDRDLVWPEGIRKSYEDLVENGLVCTSLGEEHGGYNLPNIVTTMIGEMLFQADAGFATIPLLQTGVAEMIEIFGSEELKKNYLEKMIAGEYTGSMDLTEANAGSDLGGIRAKATETDGKTYITGTKMFITNGGADVHLVLARDADKYKETLGSTKGLSLYAVPKKVEGRANNVQVTKLEDKLGIHSSPTCEVVFDDSDGKGSEAFIVGQKGKGLKYMFHLMNNARLGVAGQSLGLIEAALADAKEYATDRAQFGKSIGVQSLVKDMLKDMQVQTEVIRSIIYKAAFAVDMESGLSKKLAENPNDAELKKELKKYSNEAGLLTPLIKYYAAEKSIELTRTGVQIHGGVGYTKEFNAERYLRDAVITSIYEGTSEIQASLFVQEALKGRFFAKATTPETNPSKANVLPVLDEIDASLDSLVGTAMEGSANKVKQASKNVRDCLDAMCMYAAKTSNPKSMFGDIDTVLLHAKSLANMTVEVYGAYQLLEQAKKNDYKKTVAKVFIEEMAPKSDKYATLI